MMIVAAWLVYCVLIAGLLTLGAVAWERSARWSGRSARWGWLTALAGSVTLPWLLRLLPERGWEAVPAAASALRLEPLTLSADAASGATWSAQDVGLAIWLAVSALMLAYVALLLTRLVRASRRWRVEQLDGGPVMMTGTVGPAAVGVRRGMVVLPAWVMELETDLRLLLLRHERAHVDAGDPRMLLGGLVLLVAMPWNPAVWFQVLRLRNAIELDCDARVLSAGADPERYGSLLLEVGRRRSAHTFVMATFGEPRVFLEQRIRRIAHWPLEQRRGRAAMFAATAIFLFIAALSCADPMRVQNAADVPRDDADRARAATPAVAQDISASPVFTPMTRLPELQNRDEVTDAVSSSYPPLLRDAGIAGAPTVHFFIDEAGVVQKVLISRSSGYPALDAAALSVASVMRFSPAYNRDRQVPVWVEIPIVFSLEQAPDTAADDRRNRREQVDRNIENLRRRTDPIGRPERSAPSPLRREFTPMTEAPELINRAETRDVLTRSYPPLLRGAGIGGSPVVAFFIDETGLVQKTEVVRTSGYPALDAAALEVAKTMRFRPAKNRARDVAVWVEIPIVFTHR